MRRLKLYTLFPILSVIYGCGSGDSENKSINSTDSTATFTLENVREVTAVGKVEPEGGIVSLASSSAGIVIKLLKSRGDSVKKGEAIIQLDTSVDESKLDQVSSQIPAQRSQVEIAKESLREAEEIVRYNQEQLRTARTLFEKAAETKQNVEDLEQTLKRSEIDLANKKLAVKQAMQRVTELQKQGSVTRVEQKQKTLEAPTDGVLLDVFATVGSALKQYESYADFAGVGPVIVRAEVDELFAGKIQTGQKAIIQLVGDNQTIATGKVSYVAPYLKKKSLFQEQASDLEDRRVREIRISLDNPGELLLNGKVDCTIQL